MSDLRLEDALAREAALDTTRSFIVQAPAGSGKTELLTQRFLALLAHVERPESIVAITFTRKAAAEMRNRILQALRNAGDPQREEKMLPRTVELAREVLAADRARGWGLLANPSRLRAQTIDALNQGLARRLPVLSGTGAGLGVEEDARPLYDLAAERLLAHLPGDDARIGEAVALLLGHLDNNVGRFVALVAEMLVRREAWLPALPGDLADADFEAETRAGLEAARAAMVKAQLTALAAAMPMPLLAEASGVAREAAGHLRAAGVDSPLSAWEDCDQIPADDPDDVVLWRGLAFLLLTRDGTVRQKLTRNSGIPPDQKGLKARATAVCAALEPLTPAVELLASTVRLPGPAYQDAEWQVLRALFLVLRLATAELQVVFAERKVADYPQFAAAAQSALGSDLEPTDTALALDATLRHVLVDEFQDTSEAQVRLLERLTAGWEPGDGRTVFVVGDPMQSIYRFRHADVGLFLSVRNRGLGPEERRIELEPLTLRVNFRSTRPIVDWVNECFTAVLPAADDVARGAVSFAASVERQGAGEDGGVRVHAFLRKSRQLEAGRVADIAEERHALAKDAKIAVLVQGRSHLIAIVAELARRGLQFQATDIDPLGARPAVLDALALTRAVAHPADRTSWLAVLRAPWCGLTLAQLHALCGDEREALLIDLLRETHRLERLDAGSRARVERVFAVLETARAELRRFGLRDAVERAWLSLAGPATLGVERELDEIEAYFEELSAVEERADGAVDLAALADALDKLYAPSRPHPDIRIELMTIHKAKGLQFDTVIVPGLERKGRSDDKRLLQWTKLSDRTTDNLIVAPLAPAGDESNPLYAWLASLEKDRLQQERRRLLYVAATRAQSWLHLLGSVAVIEDPDTGALKLRKPNDGTGLSLLWPVVEPQFQARLSEAGAIVGEAGDTIVRDPPLRRLPDGWRSPVATGGPTIDWSVASRGEDLPPVKFDWASETARHVGTVVHGELQRVAGGEAPPTAGDASVLARYVVQLAELGVPADRRDAAAARVREAVLRACADQRGQWLLDPAHASASSELALTGRIGDEVRSVVIDRTFVDASGTRWIVDYKTSPHEGGGVDDFLDREQERYRPQLERYAAFMRQLGSEPIRLGLYFPLLSAWREWPAPEIEK
ncbi:MAG TPA: UvrD-helicase domain-containing protein [Steroidobacteraceae bacterium]